MVVVLVIASPLLPYWRVTVPKELQHTMLILLWSIVTRPLMRPTPSICHPAMTVS